MSHAVISGSSSELAIYFLVDHSASMVGPAFQALLDVYFSILKFVEREYAAIERVYSVMAYESTPTELLRRGRTADSVPIRALTAQGSSRLGSAWRMLNAWRVEDRSAGLCFILTDGFPTDNIAATFEALDRHSLVLVGIGCGREANTAAMIPFVDTFVLWHECEAEYFQASCTTFANGSLPRLLRQTTMPIPFFLRLIYTLPAAAEEDNKRLILALRQRLGKANPDLKPDWITSAPATRDLARGLEGEFNNIFGNLAAQTCVLVIVTEASFVTYEVAQKITKFVRRPLQRVRVVLYVNASDDPLSAELQHPDVTILTYTPSDFASGFSDALQTATMTAIQAVFRSDSTVTRRTAASDAAAPPSTDNPRFSTESTQVMPPQQVPNIPDYLRDYVSPVTFRYQPLPAKDQDPNPDWWYPENIRQTQPGIVSGGYQWMMSAASRRGFSHWHSNRQRDDAFALGNTAAWNIMAVADGAGSATHSRVTANKSCEIAVATVKKHMPSQIPDDERAAQQAIQTAMRAAIADIYDFQVTFNQDNGLDKRDTYCTFLLLVHQPFTDGNCLFGVFHVGDGYIMASSPSLSRSSPISQGDHGTVSNESYFLLNFSKQELLKRVAVHASPAPIEMFVMVTDGIEDDMKPSTKEDEQGITVHQKFERFATSLKTEHLMWPIPDEWADILDWLIAYERKGSYDDRTIAVLTTSP